MRCFYVLGLFTFLSLPAFAQDTCENHHCVGIVDVGSTGSRLYLYSFDRDKNGYPIQIEEQWSKKVTPGLATLHLKQENIDAYFDSLFSSTAGTAVPVYIYATAGMRLLPDAKQQNYYQAITQWFSHHTTDWTLKDAKTITGKEEGVYGWLAANYKLKTLQNHTASNVGVMDMGGASVQVVFPVNDPIDLPHATGSSVTVYGDTYTLFSYSALGLGQTLVTQQFLNHSACFPNGYPLADKLSAAGDATICADSVSHLVNDVHHVSADVQGALLREQRDWYAMGGIYYTAQNKLLGLGDSFSPAEMYSLANTNACQASWSNLQETGIEDAEMTCLLSSYYYSLIVNGYGISSNEQLNMLHDVGWTLGVVLGSTMSAPKS